MFPFFLRRISRPKRIINFVYYDTQYETRDFIRVNGKGTKIINYDKTDEFKNYKPNYKS